MLPAAAISAGTRWWPERASSLPAATACSGRRACASPSAPAGADHEPRSGSGDFRERRRAARRRLLALFAAERVAELLEHALDVFGRGFTPAVLVAEDVLDRGGTEALVDQLEVPGADQSRVRDAARASQRVQLAAQCLYVVREALRLVARPDGSAQPAVLRRYADRALARVADLGLDAPDREHRLARDVDHVRPESEREQRGLRKPELAGSDEHDAVGHTFALERRVDAREAELPGQRHVVGEDERRRPRAALAAVDRDEVDAAVGGRHQVRQLGPEGGLANRRLDADRQPRLRGEHLDEVEQLVCVRELLVPGRRDAVLVRRDLAYLCDLLGHLGRGKQPAETGLGALAELDLEGADRRALDLAFQLAEVEVAVLVAAAEVRGADLEDQLAAVQVVLRQSAFPRVLQAPGQCTSAVERLDGG